MNISDQTAPCGACGVWQPVPSLTPAEELKAAVEAATAALDRAHADAYVIPPQAAPAVAMLDTVARMLAVQPAPDTPEPISQRDG